MKSRTITKKLNIFIGILILLEMILILVCVLFFNKYTERSNDLFACNSELASYYTQIDDMNSNIFTYIYDGDSSSKSKLESNYAKARDSANKIINTIDSPASSYFKGLNRMLDYSRSPINDFEEGIIDAYQASYEAHNRNLLIGTTSAKYNTSLSQYIENETNELNRNWERMKMIMTVSFIASVVVSFIYAKKILNNITKPVSMLIKKTDDISLGIYDFENVKTNITEYQKLDHAINSMAIEIEKNLETIVKNSKLEKQLLEEKNKSLEMQNLVTEANLRKLQSQINPHFLFNTLNMISDVAYLHDDDEVKEMMYKLMSFLRYALDKLDTESTLKEELASIEDYIYIQKKRFGKRIKFDINARTNVPNIKMPAIILQPLIENSISHGVNDMTNGGEIKVDIKYKKPFITINVEDNGSGMKSEKLESLMLSLYSDNYMQNEKSSIGLRNIYRRLNAYFGNRLQFNIESNDGCGTIVEIQIEKE